MKNSLINSETYRNCVKIMMEKQINYTFIIPHKNIPDLLQRCLNSIPRRDDIQIIVVDDNSNPDKVDFEHFPGIGEPCVEVYFTKEGKGAGYARNVGLKYAKGKWLLFADADDFYVDDLSQILDEYLNLESEIIYFLPYSVYSDTNYPAERHIFFKEIIDAYKPNDIPSETILRYRYIVPWGKMIRKSLVDKYNIVFDEIRYANDVMFSTKLAYRAQSILVVKRKFYCITVSFGSLVNQYTRESLLCRYKVLLEQNAFLRSIGKSAYQGSILYSLISSLRYGIPTFILFLNMAFNSGSSVFMIKKTIFRSLFRRLKAYVLNNKYIKH